MKIAIVGAGISGCAAYLFLKKHLPPPPEGEEHEYTIYEAYNTPRDLRKNHELGETHSATLVVGGGIGVLPNGLNVLKRLDEELFHDVVRAGYPYAWQDLKSKHGWNLMRMPTAIGDPPISSVSLSRHALWNTLRNRVPDAIIVNKRISRIVTYPDKRNAIKFEDGSPDAEADLILGADGLKSTAKKALFQQGDGNENPFPPHYEGVAGVGGFIDCTDFKDEIKKSTMALNFGGNGFFGYCFAETSKDAETRHIPSGEALPGNKLMWWSTFEIAECPDPKSVDVEAILKDVRERHGSWSNPVIQKILAKAQIQTLWPVWTTPELPTWEKDGLVLIGDAAHALPPTSGQGSSQALEDAESFAMLLAHCLELASKATERSEDTPVTSNKDSIRMAATVFMDIRRPRISRILEIARQFEGKKRNLNWIEEWLLYLGLFIGGRFPAPSWLMESLSYNIHEEVKKALTSSERFTPKGGV